MESGDNKRDELLEHLWNTVFRKLVMLSHPSTGSISLCNIVPVYKYVESK
jgi:hypothetical protein